MPRSASPLGSPRRARAPCPDSRCAARAGRFRGRPARGRRPDLLEHALAQLDAAMVEGDRNPHRAVTLPRMEEHRTSGASSDSSSASTRFGRARRPSSGHPTSSMSAADLMAVLLAEHLRYDFDDPDDPRNDHLVFSKGHASPLLYAMYKAAGAINDEELLTFRKLGSRLEGHPTPILPWVDVATGSLGQGLPIGVGIALAGKRLDQLPYRVWVLCGDSEMAEGSMWEAFEHACAREARQPDRDHRRQPARPARRDDARLGPRLLRERAEAFGWHAIEIDGHDVEAIDRAYAEAAATTGTPTVIVAQDDQGQGREASSRTRTAGTARRSTIPRRRSRSSAGSATSWSRSRSPRRDSRTAFETAERSSCRATSSATTSRRARRTATR